MAQSSELPSASMPTPRLPVLRRVTGAAAGSLLGALAAGAISGALRAPADRVGGAVREAALFAPLAIAGAMVWVALAAWISESRRESFYGRFNASATRARETVSALLVLPSALALWIALAARAGQFFITAFHHVGLAALAQATALSALGVIVFAGAAMTRRAVEIALPPSLRPQRAVPLAAFTGLLLAASLVVIGIRTGNVDGRGGLLGAFAVLRKPELDLSPAFGLAGVVLAGGLATLVIARSWPRAVVVLAMSLGAAAGLLGHVASHFSDASSATAIDARPGLARIVLRVLRRRSDHDHDGHARLYGGGDCDDGDARRNPDARDIPGNGIDEDCSGRDAPLPPSRPAPPPPSLAERLTRETPADMNLVFITVDTLRWDLHYAGNPRPMSPNMDRLAAQSVVLDHGYALSSYTGRAIGPMLTGRYPTECPRDSEHFTLYPPANVFLAERLIDAGFRTFGAASHFYFRPRFGLTQGMTTWDMTAMPDSADQETSSADARVADRALEQLRAPENANGRFFMWVHFFDPHKQYVRHPEIAAFGDNERARYDGEVAWTDRQVGRIVDALDAMPFARRTIVVVTADHGEAFAEHGMSWHGVELWDELVRVPWIMRVPGIAPRHVSTPRGQIDLAPTLVELLRVPAPADTAEDAFSGVSLVPDMLGEGLPARPIYIELPEGPYNSMRRSVVSDGWKLTERGTRRFELYQLSADPGERTNLAATRADDLARMRDLMERIRGGLHTAAASGAH